MTFGWIDSAVLGTYFVATLAIGLIAGRREATTADFFLGGRRQHWLVAGISIIATEVSAITLIAVPAEAYRTNWCYLQMYAGAFVGRILIAYCLLPAFYGGKVTTVYEYLAQRFGPATRITGSLLFFASRTIGSGIRLLVAGLAVSTVFGWPLAWVLIGSAAVAVIYTAFGGIKAVLWTDVFQAGIFVSAALVAIAYLLYTSPGPWTENLSLAYDAGKFRTIIWDTNPNNVQCFWVLLIHATILNMAAFGTDQDMTQRMLTCRNLQDGRRSLIFNAIVGFPIVCSFLLVGTLLYVHQSLNPNAYESTSVASSFDTVFPHFIATILPSNWGLKGLLVTAIFAASMSSFASALGALSSSAITDLYRPIVRNRPETHYLGMARAAVLAFGAILICVAWGFRHRENLLWEAFQWVGLIFGGMLGVFLLGVLTKNRGRDDWNVVAMLSSVLMLVFLNLYQSSYDVVYIAWPWWVVIGTVWTLALGACLPTRYETRMAVGPAVISQSWAQESRRPSKRTPPT